MPAVVNRATGTVWVPVDDHRLRVAYPTAGTTLTRDQLQTLLAEVTEAHDEQETTP